MICAPAEFELAVHADASGSIAPFPLIHVGRVHISTIERLQVAKVEGRALSWTQILSLATLPWFPRAACFAPEARGPGYGEAFFPRDPRDAVTP